MKSHIRFVEEVETRLAELTDKCIRLKNQEKYERAGEIKAEQKSQRQQRRKGSIGVNSLNMSAESTPADEMMKLTEEAVAAEAGSSEGTSTPAAVNISDSQRGGISESLTTDTKNTTKVSGTQKTKKTATETAYGKVRKREMRLMNRRTGILSFEWLMPLVTKMYDNTMVIWIRPEARRLGSRF